MRPCMGYKGNFSLNGTLWSLHFRCLLDLDLILVSVPLLRHFLRNSPYATLFPPFSLPSLVLAPVPCLSSLDLCQSTGNTLAGALLLVILSLLVCLPSHVSHSLRFNLGCVFFFSWSQYRHVFLCYCSLRYYQFDFQITGTASQLHTGNTYNMHRIQV